MRSLVASYFVAALLWFVVSLSFVVRDPRAVYNLTADPGQVLFITGLVFVIFATPIWLLAYVILALVNRFRPRGSAADSPDNARGGGPSSKQPADDAKSSGSDTV